MHLQFYFMHQDYKNIGRMSSNPDENSMIDRFLVEIQDEDVLDVIESINTDKEKAVCLLGGKNRKQKGGTPQPKWVTKLLNLIQTKPKKSIIDPNATKLTDLNPDVLKIIANNDFATKLQLALVCKDINVSLLGDADTKLTRAKQIVKCIETIMSDSDSENYLKIEYTNDSVLSPNDAEKIVHIIIEKEPVSKELIWTIGGKEFYSRTPLTPWEHVLKMWDIMDNYKNTMERERKIYIEQNVRPQKFNPVIEMSFTRFCHPLRPTTHYYSYEDVVPVYTNRELSPKHQALLNFISLHKKSLSKSNASQTIPTSQTIEPIIQNSIHPINEKAIRISVSRMIQTNQQNLSGVTTSKTLTTPESLIKITEDLAQLSAAYEKLDPVAIISKFNYLFITSKQNLEKAKPLFDTLDWIKFYPITKDILWSTFESYFDKDTGQLATEFRQGPSGAGNGGKILYKRRQYKIRKGPRGGTYILCAGKKVYV